MAARAKQRPTGLDYIGGIFTDFFELHGDRRYAATTPAVRRRRGLSGRDAGDGRRHREGATTPRSTI